MMNGDRPADIENVKGPVNIVRFIIPILLVVLTTAAYSQNGSESFENGETSAAASSEATDAPDTTSSTEEEGAEEIRSALEEWRDTLRYGINSEISDLLPQLRENAVRELSEEVEELALESESSVILTEAIRYFTALEIYPIDERAFSLLDQYRNRPPEFVGVLVDYLEAAGAAPSEGQSEVLYEIAQDPNVLRARAAIRYLGTSVENTEDLIKLYQDSDLPEDTRGAILVALGERGDPTAFDFVAEIIGEDEEATSMLQRYAIDTLGRLGDERAIPIILRQLDSGDATTRAYAVNALRSFETQEATEAIIGALRDDFWRVRVAALETIAERQMTEALDAVIYKARRDPEQRVRLEAINTLEVLDQPAGWRMLREAAGTVRTGVAERTRIITALVESDYAASEEVLLELVEREWEITNSAILDAIGRAVSAGERGGTAPLVRRLINHPNYIIQIYAIRAVGNARIVSLREIVEERAGEGNHRAVRSAALRALEQLAGS